MTDDEILPRVYIAMATNAQQRKWRQMPISAVSVHWQRCGLPAAYKGVWGETRAFTCYGKAGLYEMPKTSKGGEGFMKWDGAGMEKVPRRIMIWGFWLIQ